MHNTPCALTATKFYFKPKIYKDDGRNHNRKNNATIKIFEAIKYVKGLSQKKAIVKSTRKQIVKNESEVNQ